MDSFESFFRQLCMFLLASARAVSEDRPSTAFASVKQRFVDQFLFLQPGREIETIH